MKKKLKKLCVLKEKESNLAMSLWGISIMKIIQLIGIK